MFFFGGDYYNNNPSKSKRNFYTVADKSSFNKVNTSALCVSIGFIKVE